MLRQWIKRGWKDERAAVAPTVALSLFGLIAAGGLAFDYARMAALDTELQQAADQAALAAVTQLDGQTDACNRATAAARGFVTNQTRFGNDGGGIGVAVAAKTGCGATATDSVRFYSSYTNATTFTEATTDAAAKFVGVTVAPRQARYALTPIVGLVFSGNLTGTAVAGLGSAICKVPPVMICNPNEGSDPAFTSANYIAKGLKLVSVGNGNSAWAPGNFGYLDTGSPTANPNVELREALGWITAPGNCSDVIGVRTRTGAGTPVTQALNTRFDIYEKANTGNGNAASCPSGGQCPPSINSVKDLVYKGTPTAANKCGIANNEWEESSKPYLPTSATADLTATQLNNVEAMGHPRDKCHAVDAATSGVCTTPFGDGDWDRNAYFKVNYGWDSADWPGYTGLSTGVAVTAVNYASRYNVYLWEIANRGLVIGGKTILASRAYGSGANAPTDHDSPVCSTQQSPSYGPGLVPGGTVVDRRRISAAVINCTQHNVQGGGGTVYPVLKWIELFLVEPSLNRARTDANDVYVEMIRETTLGSDGSTAGQVIRRDKPYLVE